MNGTTSNATNNNNHSSTKSLLSRYLIGDDEELVQNGSTNRSMSTSKSTNNVSDEYDREDRDRIQVISPLVDSISGTRGAGGGGGDAFSTLRSLGNRSINRRLSEDSLQSSSISSSAIPSTSSPTTPPITITSTTINNNIWNDDTIGSGTPQRSQYRIVFEIIKARIVLNRSASSHSLHSANRFDARRRFVNYTILMKRVPGLDSNPALIERRYSEFHSFYTAIRKKFPTLLQDIPFPKKLLIGNFSTEIITERCLGLRTFLQYCLSVPEIRGSNEFASFLYHPELREAKQLLKNISLEEAGFIFENVHNILDKLMTLCGRSNRQCIHTLCCLIGCYNAVDNTSEAKMFTEKVFQILFQSPTLVNNTNGGSNAVLEIVDLYQSCELVYPLLLLALRLRWFSGEQRQALENKLESLCRQRSLPRNFDSQPTLLEMMLKKDFQTIVA